MSTTARKWTYDDLEAIPQEREGDRHELIDGELIVTPSSSPVHQIVRRNLFRRIDQHVNSGRLGEVLYAPIDVRLTPENVVIPDIIFLSSDRLHIVGPRTVDGVPDLVVEILLPGTRRRDLNSKRSLYARFGVYEYWIVDPDARTVAVLALTGDAFVSVPGGEGGAIQSRQLPDLALTLDDVFAAVKQ